MDSGTTGALIGSTIGIIGGLVGTVCAIANTKTVEERSFVMKCTLILWIVVMAFICGLVFVPKLYTHYLWMPWALVMSFGIRWMNRRSHELRAKDVTKQDGAPNR